MYQQMAESHPSLKRGMVWCRQCGRSQRTDSAQNLQHGWPKCCDYTMTIDAPDDPKFGWTPVNGGNKRNSNASR